MKRIFWRSFWLILAIAVITLGILVFRAPDPYYRLREFLAGGRYHRHDDLILNAAKKYDVDPLLIKAVVWRESKFHPKKLGGAGERGLMQVGEGAAHDWAKSNKMETFVYADLLDAKTNLEAGTWYLKRALDRWKDRDDPIPFALGEYNAGRRRMEKWTGNESGTAAEMLADVDIASTKQYIEDIMHRYRVYQQHGW